MNKDLRKLQKQLEQLQKKDQTFIIKLIDKTYLVKGQKLTEIDIVQDGLKVYEINCYDKQFFYFFTLDDREPTYTILEE